MKWARIVVVLVGTLAPVVAVAGPWEDGKAAYVNGDYKIALRLWRPLAEQGAPKAQYNLGFLYGNGFGASLDYVLAHMWANLAVPRLPPGEVYDDAVRARDLLAKRMTAAQIEEAEELAREWEPLGGQTE